MFRSYDQSQPFLLPPSLQDFVDENHPAHLINDLVDQVDLSALEARYGNLGQPAYHPRLMLKVILYGFTVGIFSSRKLQRACQENLAFESSRNEDLTWLTQEMTAADVSGKPIFLLVQEDVAFKPGILGDIEYILFPIGRFSETFASVLEGLREVGFALW